MAMPFFLEIILSLLGLMPTPKYKLHPRDGWLNIEGLINPNNYNNYIYEVGGQNTGFEYDIEQLTDEPYERIIYLALAVATEGKNYRIDQHTSIMTEDFYIEASSLYGIGDPDYAEAFRSESGFNATEFGIVKITIEDLVGVELV